MKRLLIIEDDIGISSSLKLYLESSDFEVFLHHEGTEAIDKIKEIMPDLIILDLNLPGRNGDEIMKEYRENGTIPIILLTARGSELDKIHGLELGADDYIAKPFSPRELLARIHTIIRRVSPTNKEDDSSILKCNDIEIDISKKIVKKGGKNISLTSNEYEILKKLIEQEGKIVSREVIMKDIIGYDNYLYDRTVDTHVKNLRKKLDSKDLILTIRGEGYRINV